MIGIVYLKIADILKGNRELLTALKGLFLNTRAMTKENTADTIQPYIILSMLGSQNRTGEIKQKNMKNFVVILYTKSCSVFLTAVNNPSIPNVGMRKKGIGENSLNLSVKVGLSSADDNNGAPQ